MKIKKAVIAAAGRGTRFLPAVKSYPKELVPVLAKPNIQLLVEELIGAGITEIAIIHRHGDNAIKRYFTPNEDWENYLKSVNKLQYLDSLKEIFKKVKVFKFIPQPQHLPYGNASPAIAAKSFVGNDPFVYMFGDDLIIEPKPGEFLSQMIETFVKYQPSVVMATQQVPQHEINRYGCIKYKENAQFPNQVATVVEKPAIDQAPSTNAVLGRFVASSVIIKNLLHQKPTKDNELWWADAVNYLAENDTVINQTIKNGEWMTTGDPLRWLKANIAIALTQQEYKADLIQFLKTLTQTIKS